ncbi:hypothetical protein NPIL_393421 [Nephila pilipes]|nr:hypothetical protein NPIL_393421 [Nephila pilipes]
MIVQETQAVYRVFIWQNRGGNGQKDKLRVTRQGNKSARREHLVTSLGDKGHLMTPKRWVFRSGFLIGFEAFFVG